MSQSEDRTIEPAKSQNMSEDTIEINIKHEISESTRNIKEGTKNLDKTAILRDNTGIKSENSESEKRPEFLSVDIKRESVIRSSQQSDGTKTSSAPTSSVAANLFPYEVSVTQDPLSDGPEQKLHKEIKAEIVLKPGQSTKKFITLKPVNPAQLPNGVKPILIKKQDINTISTVQKSVGKVKKKGKNSKLSNKCHVCGKSYQYAGNLKKHVNELHKGKKLFACKICKKQFLRKRYLTAHLKKPHREKRRYLCEFCSRSYSHKANLSRHMNMHKPDFKPLTCTTCNKKYESNDGLNKHIKAWHTSPVGSKFLNCEICHKHYTTKELLHEHKVKTHKSCQYCDRFFDTEENLNKHLEVEIRLHNYLSTKNIDTLDQV